MRTFTVSWLSGLILLGSIDSPLIAQKAYRETNVTDGGTIHGLVRLTGPPPATLDMGISKDETICGSTKASPRLRIGPDNGVANAIVFLEGIGEGKKVNIAATLTLDQHKCEYSPHVMIVPLGSGLEIVNSDQILHNVHAYDAKTGRQTMFNIAQPIRGQRTLIRADLLGKKGIILATCDAGHPWMSAYLCVAEHPYYEITDEKGAFSMTDVPPGTYTIRLWHEGVAVAKADRDQGGVTKYRFEEQYELSKEVVVPASGTVEVEFDLALR